MTIEEASAYSGIGRTKLRELSNQAGCPFAIWIGNKIHIVRERLDKYIDKQFRI
ncbi:excisionase [Mediterraneibacter gnavus]|uniref:excisionase n=1 Tax=Mediterraneibacter gnavus TaxID=33038 RepID=UPI00374E920A